MVYASSTSRRTSQVKELPVSTGLDQAGSNQLLDVVRDGGLGDRKLLPQPLAGHSSSPAMTSSTCMRRGSASALAMRSNCFSVRVDRPAAGLFHSSMVIELSYFVKRGPHSRLRVTGSSAPGLRWGFRASSRPQVFQRKMASSLPGRPLGLRFLVPAHRLPEPVIRHLPRLGNRTAAAPWRIARR